MNNLYQKELFVIYRPGARFLKVAIINGPGKLSPFASNMIKLSVNETKCSSFLAGNGALILFILI